MKELQGLLWETNKFLAHADVGIEVPLIHTGTLYQVSDSILGMTQTVGRMEEIGDDYRHKLGIGTVVPEIAGLPELLSDVRSAASKVMKIQIEYARTMHEMTWLCFEHIIHTFQHGTHVSHGGIFRIQITATSAVFQILFLVWHGLYAISHEVDLSTVIDGSAFRKQPFSQVPPDLMVPKFDGSWNYTSATYENWKNMIENTHHNAPRPKVPMYRSRTADVFERFGEMVVELKAA